MSELGDTAIGWVLRGDEDARRALRGIDVILVEGVSDAAAVETAAERLGRDLASERVGVIPMGGVTNAPKFCEALAPHCRRISGMCDAGEVRFFERAFGGTAGFTVCVDDLEDELIRALHTAAVERALDAQGDLGSFRTFQNQPAQRGRPIDRQLRRFLGTTGGRKQRYARILVTALDPARLPSPLKELLD